ncbi:hypothetical protein SAMN05421505_106157 [Sinosporangium album]|uniref:Uncharacterized protein n=1 Tax=Sinosporangium album TaxID=504805 RepID=A0A1G7W3W4_9ACTN|nr:hypothetical protein SAMN05421505_106157 [Sinosporangium album]
MFTAFVASASLYFSDNGVDPRQVVAQAARAADPTVLPAADTGMQPAPGRAAQPAVQPDPDPAAILMAAYGSPKDNAVIKGAELTLVSDCMKRKDFRYVIPGITQASEQEWHDKFHLATNDDVEKSSREGYGSYALAGGRKKSPTPNGDYVFALPKEEQRQWLRGLNGSGKQITAELPGGGSYGTPADGCLAEARTELYGDLNAYAIAYGAVSTFTTPVAKAMAQDSEVTAAVTRWSGCMSQRDFAFKTWNDAKKAVAALYARDKSPLPAPHPQETRIAVADAECSQATGKSKVERDRYNHHQSALFRLREAHIRAYHTMHAQALAKAQTILK